MQPPRQTDNQAASSASPDTDRMPAWDDEGWDAYLYAVDIDYRIDWALEHGATRREVLDMVSDWNEEHDDD